MKDEYGNCLKCWSLQCDCDKGKALATILWREKQNNKKQIKEMKVSL